MKLVRLVKWAKTLYLHVGPVFHKSLEVGGGFVSWNRGGFNFTLKFSTHGDHAGWTSNVCVGSLLLELNVHDTRHWNWQEKRFYRDGEEPGFEGYPHE
jgi:hypothetical protein